MRTSGAGPVCGRGGARWRWVIILIAGGLAGVAVALLGAPVLAAAGAAGAVILGLNQVMA
ncbi:hypothetical protein [Streptomyces sp. NPDC054865]